MAHTKGPLRAEFIEYPEGLDTNIEIIAGEKGATGTLIAQTIMREKASELDAIARDVDNCILLVSAYNSYDLHCGPRAVECAEADLLGRALKALRDCAETIGGCSHPQDCAAEEKAGIILRDQFCQFCNTRAVLDLAEGKR